MNSFETDLKRAMLSRGFLLGVVLELVILFTAGFDSDLFRMSVPVLCTLPYSTAWLSDYQSGFLKFYLPRAGTSAYIRGRTVVCAVSGGLSEALGGWLYLLISGDEKCSLNPVLLLLSGMLWGLVSALLAALSGSRYLAYGGAFVIYYLLVILHERYFNGLYCLYPYEWIAPEHVWIFGEDGVKMLLAGLILICAYVYAQILKHKIRQD